jgi:hypothetical protein
MNKKQKYKTIFTSELDNLKDLLIWKDDCENYHLFGSYKIVTDNNEYRVLKLGTSLHSMKKMPSAISWCIADKINRHDMAITIKQLDFKLDRINNDLITRIGMAKRNNDAMLAEVIAAKIDFKLQQKREIESELRRCYKITKNWQLRGFNNELTRT